MEANDSEVEVNSTCGTTTSTTLEQESEPTATTTTAATTTAATPPKQSKGPLRSVFSSMTSIITSPFSASKSNSPLPSGLESSLALFTPSQQELAKALCQLPGSTNQMHLFEHWSSYDENNTEENEKKKAFMSKLESIDQSYPDGGLLGYLKNATNLLEKSRRGENPLEGWTPSVPKGESFNVGTDAFMSTEALGLEEVGMCGFVLVAGGLGERLGYGDIKVRCALLCIISQALAELLWSSHSIFNRLFHHLSSRISSPFASSTIMCHPTDWSTHRTCYGNALHSILH